jgi:hypothetical protein
MSGPATVQAALQRFAPDRLDRHRHRITQRLCACHTPAMGGIEAHCDHCGSEVTWYHGCRDRHCPQCQGRATRRWAERQDKQLLPVPYFHVVFTLPHDLNGWVALHPEVIYRLLFKAVKFVQGSFRRTLSRIRHNPEGHSSAWHPATRGHRSPTECSSGRGVTSGMAKPIWVCARASQHRR